MTDDGLDKGTEFQENHQAHVVPVVKGIMGPWQRLDVCMYEDAEPNLGCCKASVSGFTMDTGHISGWQWNHM